MHMTRNNKTHRMEGGTTLIELVIYLAISSILLTGIGAVALAALDAKAKTASAESVLRSASFSLGELKRELEQAGSLVSPHPLTASSGLMFIPSATGISERITVDGGVLMLFANGSSTPLTAPDAVVTSFTAESVGTAATSSGVRIGLGISAQSQGVGAPYNFSETFIAAYRFGGLR
jgi:type II secretory pathway pseudopilin PulG